MKTTIATTLSALSSNTTNIQQMAKPSLSLIVNSSMSGMVRKMYNSPSTRGVHFVTKVLLMRQRQYLNAWPKIFLTDFVDTKVLKQIPLLSEIHGSFYRIYMVY